MINFTYDNFGRRAQLFDGDDGAEAFAQGRKCGKKYAISLTPVSAWLVVNGFCDCVNRDVFTHFDGELFIHASRFQAAQNFQAVFKFADSVDAELAAKIPYVADLNRNWAGGIVGRVVLDGQFAPSAQKFTSYWHERGKVGWHFANAQAFERIPCRGNVGFWEVGELVSERLDALLKELPAPQKSVVRKIRTTQKATPAKSTIKQNLRVAAAPKTKRVGKTAMRAEYAKIVKKFKGPTGKKEAK